MFIQRIIKEKSEELNSSFGNMAFCKIKFHKGVEFNFASEKSYKNSRKYTARIDKNREIMDNSFQDCKSTAGREGFTGMDQQPCI